MAEYESIHGTRVRYLSSDPTLTDSSTEGQVWYNSTTGTNRALVQIKAFSSSGNTNIGGYGTAGAGTQTTGLIFGRVGEPVGGPPVSGATEEYNGFTWTEQNDLNTARRYVAGFGTQTAAVAAGGNSTAKVDNSEEYNGTSWTEGDNLTTARQGAGAAGILTAGLVFGGSDPAPANTAVTETYDGTSYSEVNDLNNARRFPGGCGTQTAALAFGGIDPGPSTVVNNESWDGTNWTSVSNLNTGKRSMGSAGTQTHALAFGGHSPSSYSNTSEEWDGSSWTSSATMGTARGYLAGAGTASSAFGATGYVIGTPAPERTLTEEYNSNINAITQAAWASGGTMPTPRLNGGQGIGTKTAAANFGGNTSSISYPYTTTTYEYNGSSWSGGGTRSDAVSAAGAFGPLTAGVAFGGYAYPPNVSITGTEEYDGSSWSEGGALGTSRYASGGAGTLTAGMAIGGQHRPNPSPVRQTSVELYNGSSWTAGTALPTGTNGMASGGTQTATIIAGGTQASGNYAGNSYDFNGSSWTQNPSPTFAKNDAFGSGGPTSQVDFLLAGGNNPGVPSLKVCEIYNGTSWVTTADMATDRTGQKMNGQAAASTTTIVAGGTPPSSGVNTSETFTSGTEVATASTLTTS